MSFNIIEVYEYLFYSICLEFKKLYSEKMDPKFYSVMAICGVVIGMSIPFLYTLFDGLLGVTIDKASWIILMAPFLLLNLYYFNDSTISRIERKFKPSSARKRRRTSLWLFFSLHLLVLLTATKLELLR